MTTPKISIETVVRFIVLIATLVNQYLVSIGKSPLPFENQQIELFISTLLTISAGLWAYWKDNDISKRARLQKELGKDAFTKI